MAMLHSVDVIAWVQEEAGKFQEDYLRRATAAMRTKLRAEEDGDKVRAESPRSA